MAIAAVAERLSGLWMIASGGTHTSVASPPCTDSPSPLPVATTGVPAAYPSKADRSVPATSMPGTRGNVRATPGCASHAKASL